MKKNSLKEKGMKTKNFMPLLLVIISTMFLFFSLGGIRTICDYRKCSRMSYSPIDYNLPDLTINGITFIDHELIVVISNRGFEVVPQGLGELVIYIDEKRIKTIRLGNLDDQSFRDIDGITIIYTGIKINGPNRRVGVIIDPNNEIEEINEFQNILTQTLDGASEEGYDLSIEKVLTGKFSIIEGYSTIAYPIILIRNAGDCDIPTKTKTFLKITCSKFSLKETFHVPYSLKKPLFTGETLCLKVPYINSSISTNSKPIYFRVELNTKLPDDLEEVDTTNNVFEQWFPLEVKIKSSLKEFYKILQYKTIRDSLIWQDKEGNLTYDDWPNDMKSKLRYYFIMYEKNSCPYTEPPKVKKVIYENYVSEKDAKDIYLAHVAFSLWIDINNKVPWKLIDYDKFCLNNLLNSTNMFKYYEYIDLYDFYPFYVTFWNPRILYEFLNNFSIIKSNKKETIYQLTDWMRAYLIHDSSSTDASKIDWYEGAPLPDKAIYKPKGKLHLAYGCHGVTGLYAAILKSINIPVEDEEVGFAGKDDKTVVKAHARPRFPSESINLAHGDDVFWNRFLGLENIPAKEIFWTDEEIALYIDDPEEIYKNPGFDADIFTNKGNLTLYNENRKWLLNLEKFIPWRVLRDYSTPWGKSSLENEIDNFKMFPISVLTNKEKEIFFNKIEQKLFLIGNGDIDKAKEILEKLSLVTGNNMYQELPE